MQEVRRKRGTFFVAGWGKIVTAIVNRCSNQEASKKQWMQNSLRLARGCWCRAAGEAQTAVIHSVTVRVNRDADDKAVMTAFWALVKKAYPDKGGRIVHSQKLHAREKSWEKA